MSESRSNVILTRATIALVLLTVAGALLARVTGLPLQPLAPWAGGAILVLAAIAVLADVAAQIGVVRAVVVALVLVAIVTLAELGGITYGFPFGQYHYTSIWSPAIELETGRYFPIFLPLAWLILLVWSYRTAAILSNGNWAVVMTGCLASLMDLGLEPVMTNVAILWRWDEPIMMWGAPLMNFFTWFGLGSLAGVLLRRVGLSSSRGSACMLIVVALASFVIGLAHGEIGALWVLPALVLLSISLLRGGRSPQPPPF